MTEQTTKAFALSTSMAVIATHGSGVYQGVTVMNMAIGINISGRCALTELRKAIDYALSGQTEPNQENKESA